MNKYYIAIIYTVLLILIYFVSDNEKVSFLFLFYTILFLGLSALSFIYLQRVFNAQWSERFECIAKHFTGLVYYSIPLYIIFWFIIRPFDHSFDNELLTFFYNKYSILVRYFLFFILWIYLIRNIHTKRRTGFKLTILLATISVIAYDVIIMTSAISGSEVWFSSVFGIYLIFSCFTGFMALLLIVSQYKMNFEKIEKINIVKMLFAVNILWAYIAFTQYLIITYANIPKELIFYEFRLDNGWEISLILIALLHFFLPFLLFLSRKAKENIIVIYIASAMIFLSFIIEMYWIIYPFFFNDLYFGWELLFIVLIYVTLFYNIFKRIKPDQLTSVV
jgi:hypothetical protein